MYRANLSNCQLLLLPPFCIRTPDDESNASFNGSDSIIRFKPSLTNFALVTENCLLQYQKTFFAPNNLGDF